MAEERDLDRRDATAEPLVDVGIPAYGRPAYLREAVESVLAQTLDRWGLLISEDGPGSSAIAEAVEPYLSDARVRYSAAGDRLGPLGNKNILLRAGSARYVAILDDDDRWHPTFLARRVYFLEEHPDCGFVFSAVNQIDAGGRPFGKTGFFDAEGVVASKDFVPRLLQTNFVYTPSVLVRRSAYKAVGEAFDQDFPYMYDWEMWFRLAAHFSVGYLGSSDADYRIHHPQISFETRPAEQILRFLDHAEAAVARRPWAAHWSDEGRRRARANWFLSATLDALERGDRGQGVAYLRQALSLHPRRVLDRRTAAAIMGLVLGRRAGRLVGGSVRDLARRHRWQRATQLERSRRSLGSR